MKDPIEYVIYNVKIYNLSAPEDTPSLLKYILYSHGNLLFKILLILNLLCK